MGESIVAASNVETKMGETAASVPGLEVSVSFGRFENDSLSWERWSSFSPNKYLEEVEKCATPGSVAQKKAYFEAHYKKIAARKAELLDQDKQMEHESLRSDDQSSGDLMGKTCGTDCEFPINNGHASAEVVKQENGPGDVGIDLAAEPNQADAVVDVECKDLLVEEVKEELLSRSNRATSNKPEEATLAKEETPPLGSEETNELPKNLEKKESVPIMEVPKKPEKEMKIVPATKKENVKLDRRKESPKIAPSSKVRDVSMIKKKPVSPVSKVSHISTPKVTKPVSNSTALSTSRSSAKKESGSLSSRSRNPPVGENKKVAPKSLHMSISMDPSNSDTLSTAPRKSFIMEKMRDKEIVKRAFKTFQNNYSQLKSSAEERSFAVKQVPAKVAEVKVSTSLSQRKENGGSVKASVVDRRTAKPAPSSFGAKNDDRAEKKKEQFLKKLDEKSNMKEGEGIRPRTKLKEEKEAEIKKLRQSHNFKASPTPGIFRGHKASKSTMDKVGSKTLGI